MVAKRYPGAVKSPAQRNSTTSSMLSRGLHIYMCVYVYIYICERYTHIYLGAAPVRAAPAAVSRQRIRGALNLGISQVRKCRRYSRRKGTNYWVFLAKRHEIITKFGFLGKNSTRALGFSRKKARNHHNIRLSREKSTNTPPCGKMQFVIVSSPADNLRNVLAAAGLLEGALNFVASVPAVQRNWPPNMQLAVHFYLRRPVLLH